MILHFAQLAINLLHIVGPVSRGTAASSAYTEKEVPAYSVEELRALNAASTGEELQVWQFFLSTGFREDEVAHACYTDIDFKAKTIDGRDKRQFDWEPLRIKPNAEGHFLRKPLLSVISKQKSGIAKFPLDIAR